MVLFGFFALVLVAIYWINRAVVLFDRLVGGGQPVAVFFEFTLLSLPAVIAQILPLAAFAGTVYVVNRLSGDSELTVMQATGTSPARLARPVIVFGLICALLMSVLTHFLVPMSASRLAWRNAEIAQNITAKLLTEGTFLHPVTGITFYIREITPDGVLTNVFLSDRRDAVRQVTYTASEAYLVRPEGVEGGSKLVMVEGLAQTLDTRTGRLSTTNFEDFTYDIGALLAGDVDRKPRPSELSTPSLIDTAGAREVTGSSAGRIADELHNRFHQPMLNLVAALIGFTTLLVGGFSRFGIGRWIILSIFYLVVVQAVQGAVTDPVRSDASMWPLTYLPAAVGLLISAIMLAIAQGALRRWPRGTEAAT